MTEIIMELSEEELPDYVNALLDQNRELREENAALLNALDNLGVQAIGNAFPHHFISIPTVEWESIYNSVEKYFPAP